MADHIQVGDAVPRVQYVANGSQTAFTFLFPIFTAADMEVWLGNARQSGSAYTISGVGISGGGTVLFAVPPATGALVTLRRRLTIARTGDYQEDGVIRAKVLNDELDYQTAALQQVADDAGRAVKRSVISASTADLTLPEPSVGKSLKWNATGNGLENSSTDMDQVLAGATTQAAAAAASAVNAHASEIAAADSAVAAVAAAGGMVKISATDTTGDYLMSSLVAGSNITLSRNNAGADETLSIAVSGQGSAAALASDSDGTLAANSDSRLATQKAVRAYVAANAGVSAADFAALQQDVIQNTLLDAITGAWAAGSYSNGGYDAFNSDTIGASSTNQSYDSANKLYGNPGSQALIAQATGTPIGNMTAAAGNAAAFDGVYVRVYPNVCRTNAVDGWVGKDWGAGVTKIVSQYKVYVPTDGIDNSNSTRTGTILLQGSNDNSVWATLKTDAAAAFVPGGTYVVNSGIITSAAYRYHRISATGYAFNYSFAQVEFYVTSTPTNMTLASGALSPAPASAPTQVKLMVLYRAIDTSTLNTDLTAEATRDGTTWTSGPLTDTGLTVAGFKVLWAVIDVSAQAGGTIVKYRLKTLNAKTQQVKGVALMTK